MQLVILESDMQNKKHLIRIDVCLNNIKQPPLNFHPERASLGDRKYV